MRYFSVCSGIEAASVAWETLGWKAVGFSEIEPFPCAVLAHHFPNVTNYGSLTEYASWPVQPGTVDLLVGGTPCQSFSVAGLRKGIADPRGNLALVFLGLADRIKPKWIVWENVPGVLSSNGGRDFGSFLGALVELGYGFAYRVLDAQNVGGDGYGPVPQRRRRVFVVACFGDWESAAKVLFESESLSGNPAKGRKKGQDVATDAGSSVETSGCWWDGGQVSQTLDAVLAKGQMMPEKNRFPAVLQPIVIDRAAFNQGENAQYDPYIEESEVMPSLVARGPHAVCHPIPLDSMCTLERTPEKDDGRKGFGVRNPSDPMYTITKTQLPMAARRLTPIECERLQGFPDNWTRIPWKGKPADQCPDGPRYKAAGNSMATNCMRWIGERIIIIESDGKKS